jgi:hypothetical protein
VAAISDGNCREERPKSDAVQCIVGHKLTAGLGQDLSDGRAKAGMIVGDDKSTRKSFHDERLSRLAI